MGRQILLLCTPHTRPITVDDDDDDEKDDDDDDQVDDDGGNDGNEMENDYDDQNDGLQEKSDRNMTSPTIKFLTAFSSLG